MPTRPGDDGVAFEFEDLCALRHRRRRSIADGLDPSIDDHDGLILHGRSTGPVDYADPPQRDDRRVDADELPNGRGQFRCLCRRRNAAGKKNNGGCERGLV